MENSSWINKLFPEAEFDRLGITSMAILLISCGGGVAVGVGAINHFVELMTLVVTTMAALALILAVAPMKWIINLCTIAVVVDIVVIALNIF